MIMMIKHFAFFKYWTCPDGTHINEEQNQNHDMSTLGIGLNLESKSENSMEAYSETLLNNRRPYNR